MVPADALFEQFLALPEHDQARFVLSHPILLSGDVLNAIQQSRRASESVDRGLAFLAAARKRFVDAPESYPLGHGPVEAIIKRLFRGEISMGHALELARAPGVSGQLSLAYVRALGYNAIQGAQTADWQQAVKLQEVVRAAAEAMPHSSDADVIRSTARRDWLHVAKNSLIQVPDGRIFESALTAARQLRERAEGEEIAEEIGWADLEWGALHLDPYTTGKVAGASGQFRAGLNRWRLRLADVYGESKAMEIERSHPMPDAEASLRAAAVRFRAASSRLSGRDRGLAQKALVQTLYFLGVGLGAEVDWKEFERAGSDALRDLDPAEPVARELVEMLQARGLHAELPAGTAPRAPDHEGELDLALRVLQEAQTTARKDPVAALEALQHASDVFAAINPEVRQRRLMLMVEFLASAHTPDRRPLDGFEPVAPGRISAIRDAIFARARAERWRPERIAASLVWLAARSSAVGEEGAGLAVLERALHLVPEFARRHQEPLAFLHASLFQGEGVNCCRSSRPVEAIEAYGTAAMMFFGQGFADLGLKALGGLVDVARRGGGEEISEAALPRLGGLAVMAERIARRRGTELLQAGYRAVSATMMYQANNEMLATLLELAKGHALGIALQSKTPYDPRADDVARELLQEVDHLAVEAGPVDTAPDGLNPLQREIVLVSFIDAATPVTGSDTAGALHNMRHAVDSHVGAQLLSGLDPAGYMPLLDEGIRGALDDHTVLLDIYLGAADSGEGTALMRIATRERSQYVLNSQVTPNAEPLRMRLAGRELRAQAIAPLVASLRHALQQRPREIGRVMTQKAEEGLRFLSQILLSAAVSKALGELRSAGKDHICVSGHGPLHFVPFHLLGEEGDRLCDRWTLTSLPTLGLLARRAARPATSPAREGAAVFGLGFESNNAFDLPPIPSAPIEAAEVARVLGCEVVPEERATKGALLDALRTRRWVHLATHGSQAIEAASFHHVYLTPDGASEGRLCAHELLGQPLAGLEVVTLSACESGLGRFDEGDNLRGLPASLLLAGCRAVVGSLWATDDESALMFFTNFYQNLAGGTSVRTSFSKAQRAVKIEHPAVCDWAPFYLIEG